MKQSQEGSKDAGKEGGRKRRRKEGKGVAGGTAEAGKARKTQRCRKPREREVEGQWLRTTGVDTNGAAAKVMHFDRLRKKVRPGTFGKIKVGAREYPKSPCQKAWHSQ